MRKLSKYSNLFILLFLSLGIQCISNNKKSGKKINHQLTEIAQNLNLSTPAVLDQHTRFDSVAVTTENIFQYHYTLINISNPQELLQEQKEYILSNMREAFKSDKSLRVFVKDNITIQYIYKDTANNIIDILTVDPGLYK